MKISIDYTYFVPHNNNRKGLIFAQRGERNEGSLQNIKPSWYALSCRIQCFSHSHRQHAATRQRGHGGILHRHLAPIFLSFLLIPVFVRFVGRKTWFFVVGEKYFVAKIIQNESCQCNNGLIEVTIRGGLSRTTCSLCPNVETRS